MIANGQRKTVAGFAVEAVPMYNIEHKMGDVPFHTDRAALVTLHEVGVGQPPLGRTPLVVLTPPDIQDAGWQAAQTTLAARSTSSSHRTVARSGGEIRLSDPAAVVRAVGDVVTAARQGGSVPRY